MQATHRLWVANNKMITWVHTRPQQWRNYETQSVDSNTRHPHASTTAMKSICILCYFILSLLPHLKGEMLYSTVFTRNTWSHNVTGYTTWISLKIAPSWRATVSQKTLQASEWIVSCPSLRSSWDTFTIHQYLQDDRQQLPAGLVTNHSNNKKEAKIA